jgi:hypothetical protein
MMKKEKSAWPVDVAKGTPAKRAAQDFIGRKK